MAYKRRYLKGNTRWHYQYVVDSAAQELIDLYGTDPEQVESALDLASDYERGHIFTEKLLRARGSKETMFLGASTIRPLLKKVIPTVEFIARPRLSKLTYSGSKKITRL